GGRPRGQEVGDGEDGDAGVGADADEREQLREVSGRRGHAALDDAGEQADRLVREVASARVEAYVVGGGLARQLQALQAHREVRVGSVRAEVRVHRDAGEGGIAGVRGRGGEPHVSAELDAAGAAGGGEGGGAARADVHG